MLEISENCFNNLSRGSIKLYAWCLSYVKKSAKKEDRFLIYRARKFLLTSAKKYSKKVWKIDFHEKWKKFHYSYLICRIQCKKPQVHTLLSSKVSFKWYTTPLIYFPRFFRKKKTYEKKFYNLCISHKQSTIIRFFCNVKVGRHLLGSRYLLGSSVENSR